MNNDIELVVIGAGPAGIEAALTAAKAGVEVLLIDSSARPGGQYFKQTPDAFKCDDRTGHHAHAQKLFQRLDSSNVKVLQNTLVWGIFEAAKPGMWCLTLNGPDAPARINARAVIVAIGAYDRSIPFPGWDLPGVITTGAGMTMIKNQRVLPGKRVILSGTGPLQLAAAANLVQGGAEVVGVLESTKNLIGRAIPYLPSVWGQWDRMIEGAGYMRTLFGAQVPYRLGWAVIEARGDERVGEVVFAKLDANGKPIPGTEKTEKVDAVLQGYSLNPSTEFFRLLECDLEYNEKRGGYVPKRSEGLETSKPGIFAAGDCAGIGGAPMSMVEGRIAGYAAAAKLGHAADAQTAQDIAKDKARLRREARFADFLGDVFSAPAGLYTLAKDDTIICRCEQITLGQLQETIQYGTQTLTDVKNISRTGMGNCQGRTCGNIVAQILAAKTGRSMEDVRYYNIRPPVHPVPLSVIEETRPELS